MVSATQRLSFNSKVHLKVHKEINFLLSFERQEGTDAAHRSSKHDHFLALRS